MKRTLTATALLLGWALASSPMVVSVAFAADSSIEDQIAGAKTAADHEAIAAEYDKMAAEAKERASMHHQRADDYSKAPRIGRASSSHFSALTSHCNTLSKTIASEAAQYEALAKEHRAIAKTIH